MSSFTAPLVITPSGRLWATARAIGFWSGEPGRGLYIEAPSGFRTDLGSIPRWLWWLLPRDDPHWAAAFVLHDWLCALANFPRLVAAALFLEMLAALQRANGGARWRVLLMFPGVLAWALINPLGAARAAAPGRPE